MATQATRGARRSIVLVGSAAVAVGMYGAVRVGWWFVRDMGWTGSGSTLLDSAEAVPALVVSIAAVVSGAVVLAVRSRLVARRRAAWLAGAAVLLAIAAVPIAVSSYPQVEEAVLVGLEGGGSELWRTELPVTVVWGHRAHVTEAFEIEGRRDHRDCTFDVLAIRLDPATGEIERISELATSFPSADDIPPEAVDLDPARFAVEPGSLPRVCRS